MVASVFVFERPADRMSKIEHFNWFQQMKSVGNEQREEKFERLLK